MSCAKHFRSAINRNFSCKGGVLWEHVTDRQLNQFLMKMVTQFQAMNREANSSMEKRAALVLGKQEDEEIYVFGDGVQVMQSESLY